MSKEEEEKYLEEHKDEFDEFKVEEEIERLELIDWNGSYGVKVTDKDLEEYTHENVRRRFLEQANCSLKETV